MKILFVGDASNMHNCLAGQLRRMGHDCTVVSNGSRRMNTDRDVDVYRTPGRWGAVKYVLRLLRLLPSWRGHDVVVLCGHHFLELRPGKLSMVLSWLKRHNRHVVLSALGTDGVYYRACHDGHTFRYNDYMVGDKPSPYVGSTEYHAQHQDNWKQQFMHDYCARVLRTIDGAVACLQEYYVAYLTVPEVRLAYAGIPIDTASLTDAGTLATVPERVRLIVGIQSDRTVIKGTDRLLAAARAVAARHPEHAEVVVVSDMPYKQYVETMRSCHVLLDQVYSYTPATNALLAMAQGLVTVSGGEPEYYELIGERDLRPIINVDPRVEGDIEAKIEWIVTHREQLPELSRQGRALVAKHNDVAVVARRWLDFLATL